MSSTRDTLPDSTPDLTIGWCEEPARAEELGRFFVAQVEESYITHGELQSGRAEGPLRWAPDLLEKTRREFELALSRQWDEGSARVALATRHDAPLGVAVVAILPAGEAASYAIVEDLVVARSERGLGLGAALLEFIERELRNAGISRVFLESGATNHAAHRFFERQGYEPCAVSMMKELERR